MGLLDKLILGGTLPEEEIPSGLLFGGPSTPNIEDEAIPSGVCFAGGPDGRVPKPSGKEVDKPSSME